MAARTTMSEVLLFWNQPRTRFGRLRSLLRGDGGMSTAEYAIGTVAAAAFATVLYNLVTGGTLTGALSAMLSRALDGTF